VEGKEGRRRRNKLKISRRIKEREREREREIKDINKKEKYAERVTKKKLKSYIKIC
jgi:hypothetical protein